MKTKLTFILFLLFCSLSIFAQNKGPENTAQPLASESSTPTPMAIVPPPNTGNPDVPIDGGISLILASGIGLGLRTLRKKEKI